MHPTDKAIQAAYAAYQRGAWAEARRHLRRLKHPKALHLLALVEKSDGNRDKAMQLLRRAAAQDSRDPEIAMNLAMLAHESGQPALAESELRRALKLRPNFQQAALTLGSLLSDAERYDDARKIYSGALEREPDNLYARHGMATALLGCGEPEEAKRIFDSILSTGNNQPQVLFMRGRCLLELGEVDAALNDVQASHAASPNPLTLKTLANILFMLRESEQLQALLKSAQTIPGLRATAADILRQGDAAEDALATLTSASNPSAEELAVLASTYLDLDRPADAEATARNCLRKDPGQRLATRNLIVSLLSQGNADAAMQFISAKREEEPNDQQWIAYQASALRILKSDAYGQLVDLDRLVRCYTLQAPEGFDDVDSFNAAFLAALEKLHRFSVHPLGQSLRDGSQTPRDLTSIDDPVFKAFYAALDVPIRQYMTEVGNAAGHPLTQRNTGNYRIAGGWSVKLGGGGRHVNHVHPEGWISSSYYVSVPQETSAGDGKAGWIKFAEPPYKTVPASTPEKWIQPVAGMLVLFPSFLWHGTEAIHDGSVRVTAPFDVVPA